MRDAHKARGRAPGFTIIELLVVIVVIILLAGLIVRGAKYAAHKSDISRAKAQMEQIRMAIEDYRAAKGYYPLVSHTNDENSPCHPLLVQLATVPSSAKDVADVFDATGIDQNHAPMQDPWGRDWSYANHTSYYVVCSHSCTNGELDGI